MIFNFFSKEDKGSRDEQIAALEKAFPNARKSMLNSNMCQYDVKFTPLHVSSSETTLRVFLPQNFPETKPVLQFIQDDRIQHRWVNKSNQVEHPYLDNWSKSHKLVTLLEEVITELRGRSDVPATYTALGASVGVGESSPLPPPPNSGGNSRSPRQQAPPPAYDTAAAEGILHATSANLDNTNHSRSGDRSNMISVREGMVIPTSFPVYESMTEDALKRLLRDEDLAFEMHMDQTAEILDWKAKREAAVKRNFEVAQTTLGQQAELDQLRAETLALQSQLIELKTVFDSKVAAQLAIENERSSDTAILRALREAAVAADEDSEELSERFCRGQVSVADFEQQFERLRRLYHQRQTCLEFFEAQ